MGSHPPDRRLNKREIFTFSLIYSLIVIGVCLWINKNFFNINDAVDEYLPFFTQMGRIWASGKFPFLTDTSLLGGNALVELSHCAFTPQSIIASLLAWHCDYKQVAAIFLAFFNMTLMGAACLVIGNLYRLRPAYSFLFSAFCTIQPVFLFMYSRSWYNSAIAQAWFVAAVAAFLLLAHQASLKNFLLSFCSTLFLLTTNFAFAILAYGLFVIVFLFFHHKHAHRFAPLAILLLASILALLFVLPLYSEYVHNSDLHNRFFALSNRYNTHVPPWSSEILTFLPTYYTFVSWFGAYKFLVLPLGFSTAFVPLVIFNRRFLRFFQLNAEARFLGCLILAYFICAQLPSTMGSMRYPLRFLPFFAFAICLATSYFLQYAERKKSAFLSCSLFILVCALLCVSKVAGQERIFLYLQGLQILLLFAVLLIDVKNHGNPFLYPLFALGILFILLCGTKFTKISILPAPQIFEKIDFPKDFNHAGYIFSLNNRKFISSSKPYATLYLQRGGLYSVRTINGYTPLGYKDWYTFLPGSWHIHEPDKTLDALLLPVMGTDMCRAQAWRISTFVLPTASAQKNRERLEKCGYQIGADSSAAPMAYASLPFEETLGWEKLPPASFPPMRGIVHESHADAFDRLSLPARDEPVQLVFPRLYWHGFRAAFNGERLDVTPDESGFLTRVTVPAGPAGILEFWFFPETWRYMWVCPALALIGLLCAGIYVHRRPPGSFWIPDIPR